MTTSSRQDGQLQRGLQNRHIQLIALGGAIGTGLFLGSAGVIEAAGPGMVLGYGIGGLIVFLIMRQLGEMIVEEPVAGSFSYFAHRYWGPFPGFLAGWNYWLLYVLVGMAELTAVGKYVQYWWPEVPTWVSAAVFFVLINLINLWNVKYFGEAEFWFSIIKVVAVVSMILLGLYLLLGDPARAPQAALSNLWQHGGFLPHGWIGLFSTLAVIMFSFGGLELVGITAAEAHSPRTVIPRAINQVVYRILIFYIGALTVLLALYPWNQLVLELQSAGDPYSASPFVKIFSLLGQDVAAHLLNLVVLTAAASVYNSGVYCNSRMLYGLAERGHAPRGLMRLSRRGVPWVGVLVSALVTGLCVLLNYMMPEEALHMLIVVVVASLVLNWALISLTHLMFRRAMRARGHRSLFPAILSPWSNVACLLFVALILFSIWRMPSLHAAVYAIPVVIAVMYAGYRLGGVARREAALGGPSGRPAPSSR